MPWPATTAALTGGRVRVRVWGRTNPCRVRLDRPAPSKPACSPRGLVHKPSPWPSTGMTTGRPAAGLRCSREFVRALPGPCGQPAPVRHAHGLYEVELNGDAGRRETLAPGWTSTLDRLRYHTYDVDRPASRRRQRIGAWLADGWYRGRLGFQGGHPQRLRGPLALIAQLEIDDADGTTQR